MIRPDSPRYPYNFDIKQRVPAGSTKNIASMPDDPDHLVRWFALDDRMTLPKSLWPEPDADRRLALLPVAHKLVMAAEEHFGQLRRLGVKDVEPEFRVNDSGLPNSVNPGIIFKVNRLPETMQQVPSTAAREQLAAILEPAGRYLNWVLTNGKNIFLTEVHEPEHYSSDPKRPNFQPILHDVEPVFGDVFDIENPERLSYRFRQIVEDVEENALKASIPTPINPEVSEKVRADGGESLAQLFL